MFVIVVRFNKRRPFPMQSHNGNHRFVNCGSNALHEKQDG